jgi:hypothetical protein
VLKFRVKTHFKQINSISLILTNLNLKFEPQVLNLFSKCLAKDPKKRGNNYHEFWSNKVHNKKRPKKTNFDV